MISKESKSLFENFKFNLNEAEEIKEDTSEELNSKIGGDYDDFISEISGLRKAINAMHEETSTHLAQQIIEETLMSLDNLLTKYEQEKDIEIVGALDEACKAEECDTKLTEDENGIPYGTYEEFENGVKEQGGLYGFIAEKCYSMPNALMREIAMNAVYELNNDEKIMTDVKERLYDENSKVEGE